MAQSVRESVATYDDTLLVESKRRGGWMEGRKRSCLLLSDPHNFNPIRRRGRQIQRERERQEAGNSNIFSRFWPGILICFRISVTGEGWVTTQRRSFWGC